MPVEASASITISGSLRLGIQQRDARDRVPAHERFLRDPMAFGVTDIDQVAFPVEGHQRHERQRQRDRARAPAHCARQVVPDGRRHREQNRNRDHRIGAAKVIQKRNQNQATAGRAEQIEKIHAIHALDAFRYRDGNHRAREKERQRAGEINAGQRQIAEFSGARQNEDQRRQQRPRCSPPPGLPSLWKMFPPRLGHNVGKQAAGAQPEQCNRDGEKREMVVKDHGEDARERKLQN